MASEGAYPAVLEEYAAAMASGTWHGYPLGGAADNGLGCPSHGVPLPLDSTERADDPHTLHPTHP